MKFTDWGTAVKMPRTDEGESRRRMTLHGPGTAGYIAPDTRGPMYDYQADMWAYLVWAASMCLTVAFVVDCQLEEALAGLRLEKKANATAGHEAKVEAVLLAFEEAGKVEGSATSRSSSSRPLRPGWTRSCGGPRRRRRRSSSSSAATTASSSTSAPGTRTEKSLIRDDPANGDGASREGNRRLRTSEETRGRDGCGRETRRIFVQPAIAETAIAETAVRASTTRTTEVRPARPELWRLSTRTPPSAPRRGGAPRARRFVQARGGAP